MKKLLLFLLLLANFFCIQVYGQKGKAVQGTVRDTAGNAQIGASVNLICGFDSVTTATDEKGIFNFSGLKADSFRITITSMGFRTFTKLYAIPKGNKSFILEPVIMEEEFNALNEVVVTAIIPVKVKEDTVEFDARAYKVREGDAVEEMVKKLPGVEVDKQGKITTEGEPVTKVRLNGKDFFGDDAIAALQNLPADIVKNMQIIDDYGELAKLTGVKSGEPTKILNINLEPDKQNGYFIKGAAGIGTGNRYAARLRANNFTDDQKLAFDGNLNNTTATDGIQNNRSVKLNYDGEWGDKIVSYGSYRFNNNDNKVTEKIARQDFYSDYTRYETEEKINTGRSNDHRFSWNVEYRINKNNYLKVQPDISFGNTASGSNGFTNTKLLSTGSARDYNTQTNGSSSGGGTNIYYNHKFNRTGRNFSVNADINFSGSREDKEVSNEYTLTDNASDTSYEEQQQFWNSRNKSRRTRVEASYMEPVNERSFIEVEYDWSHSRNENYRRVRDGKAAADSSYISNLSNDYNYQFITHRVELNYQYRQPKLRFLVGVAALPTLLKGQDISRGTGATKRTFNLMPAARFSYSFSKKRKFRAFYRGSTSQPGFTQLQPVTDNSNPQNTVIGNPDLKPELTNRLQLNYKQSGGSMGYTLFTKINLSQTQNKIVTSKTIIPDSLKQQTTYLNADGFYTASGQYSISKPFFDRKFTISYYGGGNFSRNIAFSNNEQNIGRNLSVNQGVRLRVDVEDVIDANLNVAYSVNKTRYSLASFEDRNTSRLLFGLQGRNYFFDKIVLGYDLSQTINDGYNTGDLNPTLLKMYLEYQFLKGNKARLRLQGFDLLNENTGISRDIFDNQIVDKQTNRLGRYYMISIEFRLDKFGGPDGA